MRTLLWLACLLIAYGSLFPFDFSMDVADRSDNLLFQLRMPGIGDFLGNIFLFIPLGFIACICPHKNSNKPKPQLFSILILGSLFALLLQVLQIALPQRDQNIIDALLNIVGLYIGWQSAKALRFQSPNIHYGLAALPLCIGLTYLLSELSPFVPSIDLQSIKDSIKPLLHHPVISVKEVFIHAIFWLVSIRLLFWQNHQLRVPGLLVIWVLLILGKLLIYRNTLSTTDFVAPLLALSALVTIRTEGRQEIIRHLFLMGLAFTLTAISSFDSSVETSFSWIPFTGLLEGEMQINAGSLLAKLFVFSAIIWLTIEAGYKAKHAAWYLAIYALFLEICQLWMASRTAEIGEPLLVGIAYLLVRHFGDYLASLEPSSTAPPHIPRPSPSVTITQTAAASSLQQARPALIRGALGFTAFGILIKAFLSLPGVPYNIQELFRNDGSIIDLFFFYLALIAMGGGSIWIVRSRLRATASGSWQLLKTHMIAAFSVYLLLWFAVSTDSIEDITGTVTTISAINKDQQSGSTLSVLLNVTGLTNIKLMAGFIEPGLRFMALFGLFQIPLVYFLLLLRRQQSPGLRDLKTTVTSILLLVCCYYFTFPASSTDNLTELIASPSLLILLSACFALTAALNIRIMTMSLSFKLIRIAAMMMLASVFGWILAQSALEHEIKKYGQTFSALEFILGPNRETRLGFLELLLRWLFATIAFQIVVLWGAILISRMPPISFTMEKLFKTRRLHNVWWAIKPSHLVIIAACIITTGYLGNRLFGNHMHWQTLKMHVTESALPSHIQEDQSRPHVPDGAAPGKVMLNGKPVSSIKQAFRQATDHSTIEIGPGYYNEAAVLTANYVSVKASKGAVIYGKAAHRKGALVIKGDHTVIDGLECHSIRVPDGNGKCVRLEGTGLTLINVYFHHAQGGLLGSKKGGDIRIENSLFEHLGMGSFSHGIYSLAATRLIIHNSKFLNNRNGAHEIKSRSSYTEIVNSVIASPLSRDSRLVDVPNGGTLILRDNVFVEGPFSENHDLLSWGVEGITHTDGSISISGNLFISDQSRARLIGIKTPPNRLDISNNIGVGEITGLDPKNNLIFPNRASLSLKKAPYIPTLTQ